MKRNSLWIILLAVALVAGACVRQGPGPAGPGTDQPVYGGHLVVATDTEPEGLDPHKVSAAGTFAILFNIYEGLVKGDAESTIVPGLARDWDVSADGKVYTFYLRENAYFHNGRQLIADDIVFTFERILDPATGHRRRADFTFIDKVEAVGQFQVRMTLKEVCAFFLANLAEPHAAIVPREAVDTLMTQPVGTGPFKFGTWNIHDSIVLEKFDRYHDPALPYLDKVTVKFIVDRATRVMNLQTGYVDLVARMDAEDWEQIKHDPALKSVQTPSNTPVLLVFNHARPGLDNLKVRQAITHAVNKQDIINGVALGNAVEIGTNFTPAMGFWYKDLNHLYPHNPDRARQLLREAGHAEGLSYTLSLPSNFSAHVRTGEVIAAHLERVGIKVTLELVEWGIWLDRIYTRRDYDMTVIGFAGKLDPHTVLARYESKFNRNMHNFANAEYDEMIARGIATVEPEARREIYHRAQEILAEQAVSVHIMDTMQIAAMHTGVHGWQGYAIYVIDLSTIYKTR